MSKECTVEGCLKPAKANVCPMHYWRWNTHGSYDLPPRDTTIKMCEVVDCNQKVVSRNMCGPHYHRWRKHGDPLGGGTARGLTEPQRFWPKVDRRGPNDCWPWTAALTPKGFGMFAVGKSDSMASHRWAYEAVNGPLDLDQTVDHTCHGRDILCKGGDSCRHRRCCNPAHLEAVSALENVARGRSFSARNAAKTHCKRGHPLTPDNSYGRHGRRQCKTCARARALQQQAERRAARNPA